MMVPRFIIAQYDLICRKVEKRSARQQTIAEVRLVQIFERTSPSRKIASSPSQPKDEARSATKLLGE